jgi:hypothetical protein
MIGAKSNNTSSRFKAVSKTTLNRLKQMKKKLDKIAGEQPS